MKNLLSTLAFALGGLFSATAAESAVVSLSPSATSIGVGGSTTVDVSISGLGAEILSGFDINFVWNSAVLGAPVVDFSSGCTALGAGAFCDTEPYAAGNQGLFAFSLLLDDDLAAIQSDSFLLGTLTFLGVADGATTLTLGVDSDFDRNFVGRNFASLAVDVGSTCIAVGSGSCVRAVPEPSTSALLALAVAGALAPSALRRRRAAPPATAA